MVGWPGTPDSLLESGVRPRSSEPAAEQCCKRCSRTDGDDKTGIYVASPIALSSGHAASRFLAVQVSLRISAFASRRINQRSKVVDSLMELHDADDALSFAESADRRRDVEIELDVRRAGDNRLPQQ